MPQPTIFVSHAADDSDIAHKFAKDLEQIGFNVWIDTIDMGPGDVINQINTALKRDILILIMTPRSLRAPWVQKEVNAAINSAKQGFMREPIIFITEHCEDKDIPRLWLNLYRYDATKNYPVALSQVVHAIDMSVEKQPMTKKENDGASIVVLEKGDVVNVDITKIRIEMIWNVSEAANKATEEIPNQEFDVDFAMFACHGITSKPKEALIYSDHDIVYWPGPEHPERYENHHVFPFKSNKDTEAITRSFDERYGGIETATIDFTKLPADIVRIVVYIHIYKGSTRFMILDGVRTHQLFKHANVKFNVINFNDDTHFLAINLGQKYPERWGIVLCEFLKDTSNHWKIESIEHPIDGDYINACIDRYSLALPNANIKV